MNFFILSKIVWRSRGPWPRDFLAASSQSLWSPTTILILQGGGGNGQYPAKTSEDIASKKKEHAEKAEINLINIFLIN